MATQSSSLAWKIPRTKESGRLQSVRGVAQSRTRLTWISSSRDSRMTDASGWGKVETKSSSKDIISVLQDEKNSGDGAAI